MHNKLFFNSVKIFSWTKSIVIKLIISENSPDLTICTPDRKVTLEKVSLKLVSLIILLFSVRLMQLESDLHEKFAYCIIMPAGKVFQELWEIQTGCMKNSAKFSCNMEFFSQNFWSQILTKVTRIYYPKLFIHYFTSAKYFLLLVTSPPTVRSKKKSSPNLWRKDVIMVLMPDLN